MAFLTKLMGRRVLTWENAPEALRGPGPTAAGVRVNEWSSLNLAAWWAATRIISEAVSSVPLILYKLNANGGKERARKHPLWRLLHDEPNPEMTSMVFRETLQANALVWGNGVAEIERDRGGRPIALWPLEPDRVCAERDSSEQVIYRVRNKRGPDSLLTRDQVFHIPGLGYDGLWGYSVAQKARESLGLGLATERFGASWFGNGARPAGFIKHPMRLGETGAANLANSFNRLHQGPDKAHGTAVLEEGAEWHPIGIPPEDSQFLQTRQFQREEIALWFKMPPLQLFVAKAATYASAEQFAIDLVVHTLRPWWVRWEQEIKRKLLTQEEREQLAAEHLADGLLRGDVASRTQALVQQFLNGAINLDEWRAIENRNPLPDGMGKTFFVPMNVQPIDRALAEPEPEPQPEAPAVEPEVQDDEEASRQQPVVNNYVVVPERQINIDNRTENKIDVPTPVVHVDAHVQPPIPGPIIEAARGVWREALGRSVRREVKAAERAAGKPGEFLASVDEFYAAEADRLRETLLPALRLHVALSGDAMEAAGLAERAAKAHCERSRQELLEVAGACQAADLAAGVAAAVGRWERERAQATIEELTRAAA